MPDPEYLVIYKGKVVESRKSNDPNRLEAILQPKYLGCRLELKPTGIKKFIKSLFGGSY